jgi:hypothetical protein
MIMEVAGSSETAVHFYLTAWLYIPEHCNLHSYGYDKFKSNFVS